VPADKIPEDAYYPSGLPAGKRAIAAEAAGKPLVPAFGTRVGGDHPTTTATANPPAVNAPAANAVPASTPSPNAAPVAGVAGKTTAGVPERVNPAPELYDSGMRIAEARQREARYGIEIQKKFSLAAACIVFVLVGAPLAMRFPRGGVGLVIGASFFVFAVYYIALTSGESLANRNIISPFWAMWADNLLFLAVAAVLIARMGTERVTSRGGGMSEKIDGARLWFARQGRRIGIGRGGAGI
jgi:lipopolysaccharide export system permease protein